MMTHRSVPAVLLGMFTIFLAGCEPQLLSMAGTWQNLSICGLVVLILDVIAIIELAGSKRIMSRKIVWILFIIFAPYLGLIVYYIFANRR